jgi:TrpR-related protein YerC/YecD
MPQVSKNPVPRETGRRIRKAFTRALVGIRSEREMERYIFDLLTPTEQIMLAKRLAIAALLIEGLPYREISERLKVSTATIGRVNVWLETAGDGYRLVMKRIGQLS